VKRKATTAAPDELQVTRGGGNRGAGRKKAAPALGGGGKDLHGKLGHTDEEAGDTLRPAGSTRSITSASTDWRVTNARTDARTGARTGTRTGFPRCRGIG
jgi:hypothetical protein